MRAAGRMSSTGGGERGLFTAPPSALTGTAGVPSNECMESYDIGAAVNERLDRLVEALKALRVTNQDYAPDLPEASQAARPPSVDGDDSVG